MPVLSKSTSVLVNTGEIVPETGKLSKENSKTSGLLKAKALAAIIQVTHHIIR